MNSSQTMANRLGGGEALPGTLLARKCHYRFLFINIKGLPIMDTLGELCAAEELRKAIDS